MFEIGNSLRDARIRQGLELTDLEAQTKVRSRYLRALEEEAFEQLPGESYVRGFLRLYAERLGLDGQLYVDEYNLRFTEGADEPVPPGGPQRRARSRGAESRAVLVALAGIVVVTMLVIAAWRFGTGEEDSGVPAAVAPVATGEAPAGAEVTLVVSAVDGPSRVEIHRNGPAGELLFEGTLRAGETGRPFVGRRLWISVSKPGNLAFSLDGETVEAPVAGGPAVLIASVDGLREGPGS